MCSDGFWDKTQIHVWVAICERSELNTIDHLKITWPPKLWGGLLFQSLSGQPLSELTHPHFFTLLQQSIAPSTPFYIRFLCVLKHMHEQCLLLADKAMRHKKRYKKLYLVGSRSERITEILERELSPVKLEVEEHAQFNVTIVSKELHGKSVAETHNIIHALLKQELIQDLDSNPPPCRLWLRHRLHDPCVSPMSVGFFILFFLHDSVTKQ